MLKLFIISTLIGSMIGYPIGKLFICPVIANYRARWMIQKIQNELFMQKLEILTINGIGLTPEKEK